MRYYTASCGRIGFFLDQGRRSKCWCRRRNRGHRKRDVDVDGLPVADDDIFGDCGLRFLRVVGDGSGWSGGAENGRFRREAWKYSDVMAFACPIARSSFTATRIASPATLCQALMSAKERCEGCDCTRPRAYASPRSLDISTKLTR